MILSNAYIKINYNNTLLLLFFININNNNNFLQWSDKWHCQGDTLKEKWERLPFSETARHSHFPYSNQTTRFKSFSRFYQRTAVSAENVYVASPKIGITILKQSQNVGSYETRIASHRKPFYTRFSRESYIWCMVRRFPEALLTKPQGSVSPMPLDPSHEIPISGLYIYIPRPYGAIKRRL